MSPLETPLAPTVPASRFEQIDSLRGLAALIVVLSHYTIVFPDLQDAVWRSENANPLIQQIFASPLHVFWAGTQAVTFFFVLSGFVLSLPFLRREPPVRYSDFMIKRVFRIYFPYVFALLIAVILNYLVSRRGIDQLSGWFNNSWTQPLTLELILNHIQFIKGDYKYDELIIGIWSLIQEMRISLLFPLLMVFVVRKDWVSNVMLAIAFSFFAYLVNIGLIGDYKDTLTYIPMFIAGAVLAQNKDRLILWFQRLSPLAMIGLSVLSLVGFTHMYWIRNLPILQDRTISDLVVVLSIAFVIIAALASARFSRFLLVKPIHLIGKLSYSIYLYHTICLLALVNLLYGYLPLPVILIISGGVTFLVALFSYYFIEIPCIEAGKNLVARWRKLSA